MRTAYRTHTCGELTAKDAGKEVKLCGWVETVRLQGKLGFILLRDRYGITQIFLNAEFVKDYGNLSKESVIQVEGEVKKRPENQIKKEMETGEIEVSASEIKLLNPADQLPMQLDEHINSTEETRLKYRYLDLRRQPMQKNIVTRHRILQVMRSYLDKQNFVEIETPILAKSTPEGARDYLVPSRVNKGKFYALPQSPQLFKQLLMVAGYDRYFQIARCFRDEDLRADRQPEFTQLDIEMSYVEQEDIIDLIEGLIQKLWKDILRIDVKIPFQRMTYEEAMKKYKSDKPDLRKDKNEFAFLWVVDFPLLEWDKDGKRYKAMHHPFTSPKGKIDEKSPDKILAKAYDLVLNGTELGGGSIRIHDQEVQKQVFRLLNIQEKEAYNKFGYLLDAFKYGAPPHGGIALGIDRLVAMITGNESIREVIAFPKNKDAEDLMLNAPSEVDEKQLGELGIFLSGDLKKYLKNQ